jgi:hypothetical protein
VVNVFITVDTEVWPLHPRWQTDGLARDIDRDLYARTEQGEYGVRYQLELLNRHQLKAVFFVEPFFSEVAGHEPLCQIVQLIQDQGHEVQLHLHTEWLQWMGQSVLPGRTGKNINNFSEDEQTVLLGRALQILQSCGARNVCAFRAGSYGGDFAMLRALARNGIRYDTSHNTCYLDSVCKMRTPQPLLQPERLHGVYEFPITYFGDWPGHYRHAQVTACSAQEMQNALLAAWQRQWYAFVIVSHSFELLNRRRSPRRILRPKADLIVIRRFERLCRFLDDHRDKFRTAGFEELDPDSIPAPRVEAPLHSGVRRTAWRLVEQLARRVVT